MSGEQHTIDDLIKEQETLEETELASKFSGWADLPVLIVFGLLYAAVFLQFFTRYVLNDSLSWTEEASRYLLIILTFVGIIKCEVLDSHLRLEFIDQILKNHVKLLKQISAILSTLFFSFLCFTLFLLAKQTSFQSMVSLPFPKYSLYGIIIASLVVLVFVQVILFLKRLGGDDQ